MDEKKKKMLVVAGAILAYKPPTMTKEEVKFVIPEVIEPVQIEMSGQEKRRVRRKKERVKQAKKKK